MKKLVSLALAIALLLACCALPALAEEPVTLNMTLQTASTYNHGDPNRDMSVWEAIEKACNVKLNINWISNEGAAEKYSTLLVENKLPDMFTLTNMDTYVGEGAIMALDPYLDRIPNYMRWLPQAVEASQRYLEDGKLYHISQLTAYSPAYTMVYRQDWLDNLGIEKVPETMDEWITVWKAIRDNDANKNGDPNDEIPFIDTTTFNAARGFTLLQSFGVKNNGRWYYDDEGHYSLVYENEHFREFLELMVTLYQEKLIDAELFTHTTKDIATMFNSNTAFSGYQWISRPQNTNTVLAETVPEVSLQPTTPIKGEAQLIPARNLPGTSFGIGYQVEKDPAKLDAMLRLIDFMYSDEGIFLTNYGIEGIHHTMVDGKPVLNEQILSDPSFTQARYAGLICQLFPGYWSGEQYDQILTGGKDVSEMNAATQSMYKGTVINNEYYYTMPTQLNTPAMAEYSADILPKIDELYANCVTGKITVEAFFAGYDALKPHGLQEIIDQVQAYYTDLTAE